ncbi:MAG TPA: hypothetical protein VJA86_03355, partial [Candidatus Nanoarchaeia archaeon]|nr:hypothetical protein [Candidatus Nanoarchaeia archaeon]
SEITLRKYEKPYNLEKRELVKKVCLSLGLLQPGDSRDIIVDILLVLLDAGNEKKELSSEEIKAKVEETRKSHSLDMKGMADSNIRRQLKRLRDSMLVDKQQNLYKMSEFETLGRIFEQKIEKFLVPQTIERIKEYLAELEK